MILQLTAPTENIKQVDIGQINLASGTVTWRWLDADGKPVDSGGSTANLPVPLLEFPTEAEILAVIEKEITPAPAP
jgi:hypothetical protein